MTKKSRLIPTLISLFCFSLCCYLGAWQVQRLEQKNQRLSRIKNAIHTEAQELGQVPIDDMYYSKIKITGKFANSDHNVFVFARQKANKNEQGYLVLTPFQMTDGQHIMVSRGVTADSSRTKISNQDGEVTVTGILLKSEVSQRFDPDNIPERNLWFIIDLPQISTHYGKEFGQYYLMQLSAEPDQHITQFRAEKLLNIYNPHLGYAITWFGIALAIAVIYLASIHPHLFNSFRNQNSEKQP